MIRRPAVTLIEVLIAMFIMAIGMLALLVLFPLGAISMGQALKDDRCASSASMAEQVAIAMNVRHDPLVDPLLYLTQFTQTLPAYYNGPSFPVYVDPYFASSLPQVGTLTPPLITSGLIARTTSSFAPLGNTPLMDRWFTLPNDITFLPGGTPDISTSVMERGREYSWAYLLRRPQTWSDETVDLTVVVYRKRPIAVPVPEQTYSASGAAGSSGLVLTWNPALQSPDLKRGIWLLDTTTILGTGGTTPPIPPVPQGVFYRVVNISDNAAGSASLDVQPPLAYDVLQVVIMDNVAEVFHKGTSWQP